MKHKAVREEMENKRLGLERGRRHAKELRKA